jgi:hypothetical protein
MQCVAQSAPLVGVAVTVLNRRNLKAWAVGHGLVRAPGATDTEAEAATDADAVPAPAAAADDG